MDKREIDGKGTVADALQMHHTGLTHKDINRYIHNFRHTLVSGSTCFSCVAPKAPGEKPA